MKMIFKKIHYRYSIYYNIISLYIIFYFQEEFTITLLPYKFLIVTVAYFSFMSESINILSSKEVYKIFVITWHSHSICYHRKMFILLHCEEMSIVFLLWTDEFFKSTPLLRHKTFIPSKIRFYLLKENVISSLFYVFSYNVKLENVSNYIYFKYLSFFT